MRTEGAIDIACPLEAVWEQVTRAEVIAECMPGAELKGSLGPDQFNGTITVKFGPTPVRWQGSVKMDRAVDARRVTVVAKGRDQRGQSHARGNVHVQLQAVNGVTRLDVTGDVEVTGVLGGFAKTVGDPILRNVTRQFCLNFASYCEAEHQVEGGEGVKRNQAESEIGRPLQLLDLLAPLLRRFGLRRRRRAKLIDR